jgi:ABC-type antimicrobial peptide transport system permease subunit
LDKAQPLAAVETLESLILANSASRRLALYSIAVVGLVALTLTLASVASVARYSAQSRTKEYAVRLAVGATPSSIAVSIIRQGLVVAAIGIAVGTPVALFVAYNVQTILYQTDFLDLPLYLLAASIVCVAVAAALVAPARRAGRFRLADSLRG